MSAIYKQADKDRISLEQLSLKKAVLIGETIRNPDFSSNALGSMVERFKRLEALFNLRDYGDCRGLFRVRAA